MLIEIIVQISDSTTSHTRTHNLQVGRLLTVAGILVPMAVSLKICWDLIFHFLKAELDRLECSGLSATITTHVACLIPTPHFIKETPLSVISNTSQEV